MASHAFKCNKKKNKKWNPPAWDEANPHWNPKNRTERKLRENEK